MTDRYDNRDRWGSNRDVWGTGRGSWEEDRDRDMDQDWDRYGDRPYRRMTNQTYNMDDRYRQNRQSNDWREPGPYTGVGPKNYRRKDEYILDDVNERLMRHGQIDPSNISVEVSEAEVTLNGMVRTRREKSIAEYVAESVRGVREVHNHLRVSQERRETWKAPGEVYQTERRVETGMGAVGTTSTYTGEQGSLDLPERVRGEGMTAIPDTGAGETTAPYEGMRYEAEVSEEEGDEPQPTGGPPAIASGPTDIASGSSGSTLGDELESRTTEIPRTGRTWSSSPQPETETFQTDETDFQTRIRSGMQVVGSDREPLGTVKEVSQGSFLLDRPLARDVYVPFHACSEVTGDQVVLNITSEEISEQGWFNPPIL